MNVNMASKFCLMKDTPLSLPRQRQGKEGLQDWLMDQVARFIADLTSDLADSVELLFRPVYLVSFNFVFLFGLS